jgi:uncharacterized protein YgiM (DUF1202 family)
MLTAVSIAPASAAVWGTVTTDGVNLRTAASTDSDVATVLNKGTNITVAGKEGSWYALSTANYGTAYIHSDFFKVTAADATITSDSVNVRRSAEIGDNVAGQLHDGNAVTVTGQANDWYRINYNGSAAYVSKDFVQGSMLDMVENVGSVSLASVEEPEEEVSAAEPDNPYSGYDSALVVAEAGLNLRKEPTATSGVVKLIPTGATIYVVDIDENGWAQVKCVSGAEGYVAAEFLQIDGVNENIKTSDPLMEAKKFVAEGEWDFDDENGIEAGSLVDQIIEYAKMYIGTPYVWAGTDLETGVDCSGFIYCVLKNFGISVIRTSKGMSTQGTYVKKDDLQPGDLVFFDSDGVNDGNVSHVGMYIGSGKYIHSSSGKAYGVTITNLGDDYSTRTYVTARRVF